MVKLKSKDQGSDTNWNTPRRGE